MAMLTRTRLTQLFSALVLVATSSVAAAPASLAPLVGNWTGTGTIKLTSGQSEAVKCKVYYTDRGANVGVALRCASSGAKIDLRATLLPVGANISGTWEERQFNAAGSLVGGVSGNRMTLEMEGGGIKANVIVATSGANQTLTIMADNGGFKSVSIAFARE
jgi:hypothetical protein